MNALAASAEADVYVPEKEVETAERERDRYKDALYVVLGQLNSFGCLVGDKPQVSRRVAVGAAEVMAGLIEEALGR
jgi:hypothetical protein